jgi:hypothetical protein
VSLADRLNKANRLSSDSLDRRQVRAAKVAAFVAAKVDEVNNADNEWDEECGGEMSAVLDSLPSRTDLRERLFTIDDLDGEAREAVLLAVSSWHREMLRHATTRVHYTPDIGVKLDRHDVLDLVDDLFPEGAP